ncbi:hypothetical protein TGRH88_081320 [Toxoplasma gondii]|uniref:Transmembrane protein n=1 Tax=Toxoplasma gondii TaxID=5811 RepID=A0A7J6K5I4_TOXGO|nr:hypothetical protein TGRH88_081320 [Toxoplasma gondii]
MPVKVSGLSIVCLPLLFSEMFGILLHTLHPFKNSRGCMAFSATEKQACSLSKRPTRQGRSDLKSDTGIVACPQPGELAEILLAFACFILFYTSTFSYATDHLLRTDRVRAYTLGRPAKPFR